MSLDSASIKVDINTCNSINDIEERWYGIDEVDDAPFKSRK